MMLAYRSQPIEPGLMVLLVLTGIIAVVGFILLACQENNNIDGIVLNPDEPSEDSNNEVTTDETIVTQPVNYQEQLNLLIQERDEARIENQQKMENDERRFDGTIKDLESKIEKLRLEILSPPQTPEETLMEP